jgi:hypothetical protein
MQMKRWPWVRGVAWVGFLVVLAGMGDTATAAGAPALRYGFQKDKEYVYNVKLVAELPHQDETRQGTMSYTVLSAESDQFTIKCWGSLGHEVKTKGDGIPFGEPPFGPRGFGGPRGFHRPPFGPFAEPRRPEGWTFTRQGDVVMAGQMDDLPYLLGKEAMLVIESLPKEPKSSWTLDLDLGVVERSGSPHHFGPFAESETNRGAKERIDYSVLATDGDLVRISKKYSLKTAKEANGVTHIDMSGDGELAFDLKQGVFQSQSMKYRINVNDKNVSVAIPVTVDIRLLTKSEMEKRKTKETAAKAAAAEAAKSKPLAPGERERLMKDLASRDAAKVKAAAKRLSKAIVEDHKAEVSRALAKAMRGADDWTQGELLGALKVWVVPDPETEAAVIAASKSKSFIARDPALGLLGNFKTAKAAQAAADGMLVNWHAAEGALKAMGPVAESVTIPLLKDRDFWIRGSACGILGEIGGKKSLQALKTEAAKLEWHEQHSFNDAIKKIQQRLAQDGVNVDDDEKPAAATAEAEPEFRTWHDSTGTYTLEAVMTGVQDGKVALKKKSGGREVKLPLEKLSAEDQEYVKKQTAPKPANPFEQ